MNIYKIYFHICAVIKRLLLKLLFGRRFMVGKGVTWRRRFSVMIEPDGRCDIGDNVFFNNDCSINCIQHIVIGQGCLFGEGVKIYDHNHRFRSLNKTIKEQGYSTGEIVIGNNCWIGSNVVILKGAQIGNNCVIGAGCVIDQRILDNTIVKMNREVVAIEKTADNMCGLEVI